MQGLNYAEHTLASGPNIFFNAYVYYSEDLWWGWAVEDSEGILWRMERKMEIPSAVGSL